MALDWHPLLINMGLALERRAHFQKGCPSSSWARLRNTRGIQHDPLVARELPQGSREPPRDKQAQGSNMGLSSRRHAYFIKTAQTYQTLTFCRRAHLPNARLILARKERRPNAKHGPSRNKSPLSIGEVWPKRAHQRGPGSHQAPLIIGD